MAMDHIQQYHVTSTCPKAYGGKLVDSLTECKAFEQSLGSAPVSDSATWRIRHNKHASARTTPRTDELLNFTELPSPRCGRQCQWSQRTWYCTALIRAEGALVSDALIRDLASEEEVTLGEALFRAGQTRAPGTEGLSAAYLAHERALAAEHALRLHRESGAAPEIWMAMDYI